MAMPTVELEIKLVQEQLKAQARKEIEGAWRAAARTRLGRELNAQENKKLLEEINKLFFGREEWLKQKREAFVRINRRALTVQEETAINTEVNQLLKDNPAFISGFKYETDALSESQAFASDPAFGAIQGFFSKITDLLANTPFSFLGKLIEFVLGLFSKLMPAVKELGEKLNPPKTPEHWLNEGNFDDADVELRKQEAQLLTKMDSVLKDLNSAPLTQQLQPLLTRYRNAIEDFEKRDLLERPDVNDLFKRDNLKARMTAFSVFSRETSAVLKMHEEEVALSKQINAATVQEGELAVKLQAMGIPPAPPATPESELLVQRLAALRAEIAAQTTKRNTVVRDETRILTEFETHNHDAAGALWAPLMEHKVALDAKRAELRQADGHRLPPVRPIF